jgi:hypothetical protein
VQRTSCIRKTQEQTTWRILIIRIILDNGSVPAGLTNISLADISFNNTFEGMATELEYSGDKALAYFV